MKFSEKVRKLRRDMGWSQQELAKRLGVSTRTIFTYESGKYPRYRETYDKLAQLLGVDVNYLRTEDEEFTTDVMELYGQCAQEQARTILEQTQQLFASGALSEDDEIAFIREVQRLYLDSKERTYKFMPGKYLRVNKPEND